MPYGVKCEDNNKDRCYVEEGSTGRRPGHKFSHKPLKRDVAIRQLAAIKTNERGEEKGD